LRCKLDLFAVFADQILQPIHRFGFRNIELHGREFPLRREVFDDIYRCSVKHSASRFRSDTETENGAPPAGAPPERSSSVTAKISGSAF